MAFDCCEWKLRDIPTLFLCLAFLLFPSAAATAQENGSFRPQVDRTPGEVREVSFGKAGTVAFVWIPPGTFRMGNSPDDPRDPAHPRWYNKPFEVTLRQGFWMARTEVTQKVWRAVMGSNPSRNQGDNLPVENVSWDEAQVFLKKAGATFDLDLRLPTEAEWEWAARAGEDKSRVDTLKVGWTRADGIRGSMPVAIKEPSKWGLYDLFGNVNEWCQDHYGPYPTEAQTDWAGPPSGTARVTRGGSFTGRPRHANRSDRGFWEKAQPWVGFRMVLSDG